MRQMRHGVSTVACGLAVVLFATAIGCREDGRPRPGENGSQTTPAAAASPATYVGRPACVTCHEDQEALWRGSHHDLAMQEATPASVLGNFDNASFTYAGVTSRFSRRDGRFVVRTDGPDGRLQDFEVAYVFGVYPLQQYLIGFPDGRYQALSIAWDSRPKAQGGQRWFHLYPDERVTHGDVLHWTQFSQNWNAQCASCHSTNLRKAYDRSTNTYKTTWSEIDVSCEQCHGPASAHVAWAEARPAGAAPTPDLSPSQMGLTTSLRDRRGVRWTMDVARGIAARTPAAGATRAEVDVCAPCHARRAERFDGHVPGQALLDSYRPSLLSDGLYRADGQMQDEVYNYGSFLQSRMHAAGVTCSDCHDPHSLKLRAEGNAVCAQCHLPSVFDVKAHHGHAPASPGASCAGCHMPTEVYMGVDRRHDHGFRVPRPDLSATTGAPDTCTTCHEGKAPAWAAAALDRWFTPRWRQRPFYGPTFAAARQGRASSGPALLQVASDPQQPGIVRGSAIELLQQVPVPGLDATLERLAVDADPLVRLAVAQALPRLDPASRARVGGRLLMDPLRVVRVDAATAIAGEAASWLPESQRAALARSLDDARASDLFNGDRPESFVNLALQAEREGDLTRARQEYEAATRYAPWFVPAYVNLADVLRRTGDETGAEQTLRRALQIAPDEPNLLYALGLALYRQQRGTEATAVLARAARLAPDVPRYPLAHALALEAQGQVPEALAVVDGALSRHPDDRDLLDAGLAMAQKVGDQRRAREYVRRLLSLAPGDPALVQLARSLGVM